MSEFKPIDTADKDAHRLLLGIVRKGVLEETHIGGFRYAINEDEESCWWSDQSDDEIVPTHWAEIPELPITNPDSAPHPSRVSLSGAAVSTPSRRRQQHLRAPETGDQSNGDGAQGLETLIGLHRISQGATGGGALAEY